jgi:hypothetical protein
MDQQPGLQQVDTTCGSLLRELQVHFYVLLTVLVKIVHGFIKLLLALKGNLLHSSLPLANPLLVSGYVPISLHYRLSRDPSYRYLTKVVWVPRQDCSS